MKQQKITIILSLILAGMLIFFASNSGPKNISPKAIKVDNNTVAPVQTIDGKQIIEVMARGGYNPRDITVKAGVPTILRMKTSSTFDCSASFTIASLGIQKMLPATGVTDFEIPSQKPGSIIHGTCGMGMYSLNIRFE